MENLKIIQISTASPSLFLNSGKGDIRRIMSDDWFAQVGKQIKKFNPKLEIECWVQEKKYKKEEKFEDSGIKFRAFPSIISIRPGMELSFKMIGALKEEIKNNKNKKLIIHIHEYHSWQTYLILLFLKRQKNIRIITQHHGGKSPFKNLKRYKRLILFLPLIMLMQIFENLLFKKIDLFYAFGNEEENYLKKITNSKIKFQTMGIDDEYFKKIDKKKARKILGLEQNKKYLLYLGRIKTTKGIGDLLEAIKGQEIELLLIGEGPDFNRFKQYAENNNLKNVSFLGAIYNDEKLTYLSACDYLVLPSYTEGAPVVIMEALAKNMPVIATRVGGVANMIKQNESGILINPKNPKEIREAINTIINWKEKDLRKYAEKYKWKEIVYETVKDYKEV